MCEIVIWTWVLFPHYFKMNSRWKLCQFSILILSKNQFLTDVYIYMTNNNGQTQTSPSSTTTTHLSTSQLLLLIYKTLASGKITPYNSTELLQKMIILSIDYISAEDFCSWWTLKNLTLPSPERNPSLFDHLLKSANPTFLRSPFEIIYIHTHTYKRSSPWPSGWHAELWHNGIHI